MLIRAKKKEIPLDQLKCKILITKKTKSGFKKKKKRENNVLIFLFFNIKELVQILIINSKICM